MNDKKKFRSSGPRSFARTVITVLIIITLGVPLYPKPVLAVTRPIIFPVIGNVSPNNDFGAQRAGHAHMGNDILGKKMMPLVAVADGVVRFAAYPQPDYGYLASIEDNDGYQYWYLHINNDHIGTDDGQGGGPLAYAPGIASGNSVVKGQLIGWMGDSGNAETTSPHLHFELHAPDGTPIDPYSSLIHATRISQPVIPPPLPNEILPFGEFRGGAHITFGQTDPTTASEELVAAAGPSGGPLVKILNPDGLKISQFYAYPQSFHGGVDLAAADMNGDGVDEIITVPGAGGGPQVKIFNAATGEQQIEFYAYSELFKKGISVAAADLDGDGNAEIITGAGPGMEPRVKVFSADGSVISDFLAYAPGFHGGVDVAAIAATSSSPAMIVTGPGRGGGPDVHTFTPSGQPLSHFFAYAQDFRGGVRVDVADVLTNNDTNGMTPEIVTVPASGGGPQVRVFTADGTPALSKFSFEPWWSGGYDVAAGQELLYMSSAAGSIGPGGRRASIRIISTSSTPWWLQAPFRSASSITDPYRRASDTSRL